MAWSDLEELSRLPPNLRDHISYSPEQPENHKICLDKQLLFSARPLNIRGASVPSHVPGASRGLGIRQNVTRYGYLVDFGLQRQTSGLSAKSILSRSPRITTSGQNRPLNICARQTGAD
ncbi:hypothetical protein KCV03_g210, partial [Aureobasidium melanogenum]